LPGGWGKLTMGQMALITAAAVGKAGGGASQGAGMSGGGGGAGMGGSSGMGMGMRMSADRNSTIEHTRMLHEGIAGAVDSLDDSPFSAEDLSQMDPQTLELYRQAGLVPQDPNQLQSDMESQSPGILQTLSEELKEYFAYLEQEEDEQSTEDEPAPITTKDQKGQEQLYKKRQHELTREEQLNRGRDFRTNIYQQGGYRGPFPKTKMLGPAKSTKPSSLVTRKTKKGFTGRGR